MLDSETKHRIDTARNILVGKVPDPKSQVEQITIALIYKFMDDMDAESEEFGGTRKFFSGDFARYGWAKLMRSGLGGHEALGLYAEAIQKMPENPGIPLLFRDIFKNAYLPYRDPETLRAFLKIIDEFTYDHSERLGDAFEYLLSVLGSQGDAGQFRTPRHIIDFMVEIVAPQKHETVLDPACGTAGFLISSYKHIARTNVDAKGNSTLTPDDRARLAQNFKGYDISPDMVRLSLVNLYLHGFTDPHIFEYDSLTSEERWNEYADVILANPPFMSPKGGIKPHKRFSIQAKRSEVLFVDYMAEHLAPNGRAAIIVPEGIIFQSQTAYKALRKMLVEQSLVAVISLPAGCFNPYSGVKTSILILDKALAKSADTVAFFKVENDGFGLGAQRRAVSNSDLPQVQKALEKYLTALRERRSVSELSLTCGLIVNKEKLAANGEFSLSAERYRASKATNRSYPHVAISEVCSTSSGGTPLSGNAAYYDEGQIPWLRSGEVAQGEVFHSEMHITDAGLRNSSAKVFPKNTVLVAMYGATAGAVGILRFEAATNQAVCGITPDERLHPDFLYLILKCNKAALIRLAGGGAQPNISQKIVREFQIPLPPLEVQTEIVAEVEGYQKVIDGARAVVDNYRPHIPVNSNWPIVQLSEIFAFKNGLNFDKNSSGYSVKIIGVSDFRTNLYAPLADLEEVHLSSPLDDGYLVKGGDILFVRSNGNPALVGRSMIVPVPSKPTTFSGFTIRGRIADERASPLFFAHFFKSRDFAEMIKTVGQGANIRNLSQGILNGLKIPLPPITTQQAIVAEIEAEQALVNANRELIARFEKKIQATLARVWGEAQ